MYNGTQFKPMCSISDTDSTYGSWQKDPDGTLKCWQKTTVNVTMSAQNLYGSSSGWTYFGTVSWTFPTTFVGTPEVFAISNQDASTGYVSKARHITTTSCTLSMAHVNSVSGADINGLAVGFWK